MATKAGDTQGPLIQLNLALDALAGGSTQGNITATAIAAEGNATSTASEDGCDGITVGGTSAADDHMIVHLIRNRWT